MKQLICVEDYMYAMTSVAFGEYHEICIIKIFKWVWWEGVLKSFNWYILGYHCQFCCRNNFHLKSLLPNWSAISLPWLDRHITSDNLIKLIKMLQIKIHFRAVHKGYLNHNEFFTGFSSVYFWLIRFIGFEYAHHKKFQSIRSEWTHKYVFRWWYHHYTLIFSKIIKI